MSQADHHESPEFMRTLLTEPERVAMEQARLVETAEAVLGFAGLMQAVGVANDVVIDSVQQLRSRLDALPLNELRNVRGGVVTLLGSLGAREDRPYATPLHLVESLQPDFPDRLERVQPTLHHGDDARSETTLHTGAVKVQEVVPEPSSLPDEVMVDVVGEPTDVVLASSAHESRKPQLLPGEPQVRRMFKGILGHEDVTILYGLSEEARQDFVAVLKRVYCNKANKLTHVDIQMARIETFLQGKSRQEVAEITGANLAAIDQAVSSLNNIFTRDPRSIQTAFTRIATVASQSQSAVSPGPNVRESDIALEVATRRAEVGPRTGLDARSEGHEFSVKSLEALAVKIGLPEDLHDAFIAHCSPDKRSSVDDERMRAVYHFRRYITDNFGDFLDERLDIESAAVAMLRKLTGLYYKQDKVSIRPPRQLTEILEGYVRDPMIRKKAVEALYGAFAALSTIEPVTTTHNVAPDDTKVPMEVVTDEQRAEITVREFARLLHMDETKENALWQRLHRDLEGMYRITTDATKAALEAIQTAVLPHWQRLATEHPQELPAFKAFIMTAFGGPKNLDVIAETVDDVEPEKSIVVVLAKLKTLIEADMAYADR